MNLGISKSVENDDTWDYQAICTTGVAAKVVTYVSREDVFADIVFK